MSSHSSTHIDIFFADRDVAKARTRVETATRHALRKLVTLVCKLSRCSLNGLPVSPHDRRPPEDFATGAFTQLHVFIYFDEAHVLRKSPVEHSVRYPFDVLARTLEIFRRLGAFTVFLSTQFDREPWTPPFRLASSARYRQLSGNAHAPITETPFDCFGSRRLNPSRLKVDDVDKVELMACFGRPM